MPARFSLIVLCALTLSAAEVVPGVQVIRGTFTPGSQPDGNSVILNAPEGLIVVDTGRHPTHTQAVLDAARAANEPIVAVINTHWHLDHIGGNARIRKEFPNVRIYASNALQGALTGFLANYRKQLEEMIATAREQEAQFRAEIAIIDSGAKLAPDVVVTASGDRTIAGRALKLGLETNTVTEGDVWILDPETHVLIAGDLVTLPVPFLDTACPQRWQDALDSLSKVEFDLLIPGHGAPMTRTQFLVYRDAYRSLLQCAAGDAKKEQCTTQWIASVGRLQPEADEKFTGMLAAYYVDVLRAPERFKKLCGEDSSSL